MKKVRLIASKLNVEIESEMIVLYTVEGDDSEVAVIPLSYCSIVDIDDGTYPDDGITFTLGFKRTGERAYLGKQTQRIRFPSDRDIRFPYCVHKTIDDIMNSYFVDDDLAKILMKFLDTIANLNYEYLRSHRVDAATTEDISRTMHGVRKAKRIVSKKLGTEKSDEH